MECPIVLVSGPAYRLCHTSKEGLAAIRVGDYGYRDGPEIVWFEVADTGDSLVAQRFARRQAEAAATAAAARGEP